MDFKEYLFKIVIRLCSEQRTSTDPQDALEVILESHKDIPESGRLSRSQDQPEVNSEYKSFLLATAGYLWAVSCSIDITKRTGTT